MLALAGGMLDGEDNYFLGLVVSGVVNQISISARHQLPHALHFLLPSNLRKQDQTLKRLDNSISDAECCSRIVLADCAREYSRQSQPGPEPHAG